MTISDIDLIKTTILEAGFTSEDRTTVGKQLQLIGCVLLNDLYKDVDKDDLNPIFDSTLNFMKSLVEQIKEHDKEAQTNGTN